MFKIVSIRLLVGFIPSDVILNPKYSTSLSAKRHFDGLRFIPEKRSLAKTSSRSRKCSSNVYEKINMSSMYTKHCLQVKPCNTRSMRRLNVLGAFILPNGIQFSSYNLAHIIFHQHKIQISFCSLLSFLLDRMHDLSLLDTFKIDTEPVFYFTIR